MEEGRNKMDTRYTENNAKNGKYKSQLSCNFIKVRWINNFNPNMII